MQSPLFQCILAVFGLLAFATVTVFILRKSKPHNETLGKVAIIVKSWWYIATPLLAALYLGPLALMVLFFVVSCFAMREFIKYSRFQTILGPLFALVAVLTVAQYLLLFFKAGSYFYVFIPLSFVWIVPILIILKPEIEELPTLVALVLSALLFTYYLSYVPALPWLGAYLWPSPETPLIALLILVFLTEANDVFQFLSGKSFGKHKIVPAISPNKTEAGFIGGFILTTLASTWIASGTLDITKPQAAILGAMISITGMLGDLLFSAIKRHYGVKDFSALIPGHGGILDRLDSLILTAPVFFHILIQFKGGSL